MKTRKNLILVVAIFGAVSSSGYLICIRPNLCNLDEDCFIKISSHRIAEWGAELTQSNDVSPDRHKKREPLKAVNFPEVGFLSHKEEVENGPAVFPREKTEIGSDMMVRCSGLVLDPSGNPLPCAAITALVIGKNAPKIDALGEQGLRKVYTGRDGGFEIVLPSASKVAVCARCPGYSFAAQEISIPQAGETYRTTDFRLAEGGSIKGKVIDKEGAPLGNVSVTCIYLGEDEADLEIFADRHFDGLLRVRGLSDEGGSFFFWNLKAGSWKVSVPLRKGEAEITVVEVFDGGETEACISLASRPAPAQILMGDQIYDNIEHIMQRVHQTMQESVDEPSVKSRLINRNEEQRPLDNIIDRVEQITRQVQAGPESPGKYIGKRE
jgi:hypothetical protein